LLDNFCTEVGITPLEHAEFSLAKGRADAVFTRLIIEYERPGVLSKSINKATQHAIDQVKSYIIGLGDRSQYSTNRVAGVAFDGYFLIFIRFLNGRWYEEAPIAVNINALKKLLYWLTSISTGKALTAENLYKDFALEKLTTQSILRLMFENVKNLTFDKEGIVNKLFSQWKMFFSESINYSDVFGGRKLESLINIVKKANISIDKPADAEIFFFVLHTYFSLIVKFIAWSALSKHMAVRIGAPSFSTLLSQEGFSLRDKLQEMEQGGIFAKYGISNIIEGDFFSWYIFSWNSNTEKAIHTILSILDDYDPSTLAVTPEHTRDLFKKLYHYLLPKEIRHNLGEYYTPDWLANRLLTQIDNEFFINSKANEDPTDRQRILNTRWLDPACGSGTFLVSVIRRIKELSTIAMINETTQLNAILNNVVGFDLNPLSVLTSRVNYLLEIIELLQFRNKEITIPIYLADSVLTPSAGDDIHSAGAYNFPTSIGSFLIPDKLCKVQLFDTFCNIIDNSVKNNYDYDSFRDRVLFECKIESNNWNQRDESRVRKVYNTILEFHIKGMNGLWARLLKNNFAPLICGRFDRVVGNPPWINWENLPDKYRDSLIPIYQDEYKLFPHRGFVQGHGSAKVDISTLMTYVVADRLLKDGGRLGFVITESVFKTDAGKGFRKFTLPGHNGEEIPLRVITIDDMVDLNPFENASNRTAVIIFEKNRKHNQQIPYIVWKKIKEKRFNPDSDLYDVISATKRLHYISEPIDPCDYSSFWLCARPNAIKAIRSVIGKGSYNAHAGVYTGLNSAYWIDIIDHRPDNLILVKNIVDKAKIKVDEYVEPIESDLVYPLLRARDLHRWKANPSASIIIPHDPNDYKHALKEVNFKDSFIRTYKYLEKFKPFLESRPVYTKYLAPVKEPWYCLYDIKNYTFSKWKVVWTRVAKIEAAVISQIDGKLILPQETIVFVDCNSNLEAHYITALINSIPFQFAIYSYSSGGKSLGSCHVLNNVRIDKFNPNDETHQLLASFSINAHSTAKISNDQELYLNELSAIYWNINIFELKEITDSFKEIINKQTRI